MAASFLNMTQTPSTSAFSPIGMLQQTGASTFSQAAQPVAGSGGLSSMLTSPSMFALGSLLSTGFQVFSSMKASQLEQRVFDLRAQQQELQAGQMEIAATEQANETRRRLLDNLAASDASFAAAGVSLSSGTPLQAQRESRKRAGQELERTLAGGRMRSIGARSQAEQLRAEGASRKSRGLLAASEALGSIGTPLSILAGNF